MTEAFLDLPSGRPLFLHELRQFLTYEGLLEGLPTVDMNRERMEWLMIENTGKPYPCDPYLIQPIQRLIHYDGGDGKPYPFGTPSALPEVTCIGRFESIDPARNREYEYSGLAVIWFQDEFALPVDPSVLTQLRAIDWEALAADLLY